MDAIKKISLVIPVYNEEVILEREVAALMDKLAGLFPPDTYEVLLVENGSFDRTRSIVASLAKKYSAVRPLYLPTAGYGQALCAGLLESQGQFVALFNIDLWDTVFLQQALVLLQDPTLDMVVGSKTMRGAKDTRPWLRRTITRGFNMLLRFVFGFAGTDTHGMKVLRREPLLNVVRQCRTKREIFDTEFVLRAQYQGLRSVEIPVACAEKRNTTYHISKRIPRVIKDLTVLFFSLHRPGVSKRLFFLGFGALIIFLVAAWWGFPDSPSPWFDEGINIGIARTLAEEHVYSLHIGPGQYVNERGLMISTNYPALVPIALTFYLFGSGLAQAQIVMEIFLVFFLIVAVNYIRRSYGTVAAIWSFALVVTFLPFYGNGLSGGLGEVPGLCFLFSGLYYIGENKKYSPLLAGIFFGLAAATKVFYLVALAAVVVAEFAFAVKIKMVPWRRWFLLMAGALPPLVIWGITLLPLNRAAPWSAVLNYYRNPYHVEHTVGANLLKFITETTPIHFTILFGVFIALCLYKWRHRNLSRQEVIVATFAILNVAWFVRTPGWYRYLFPAHLTLLVFFPAALEVIIGVWGVKKIMRYAASGILIMLLAVQCALLIKERGSRLYFNPEPREFSLHLQHEIGLDADVDMVDQPELWPMFGGSHTRQYIHMNPYIAFGEDFFATGNLPQYIVCGNAAQNEFFQKNQHAFSGSYALAEQYGHYSLYKRKF